jgi:hypothetical protein
MFITVLHNSLIFEDVIANSTATAHVFLRPQKKARILPVDIESYRSVAAPGAQIIT